MQLSNGIDLRNFRGACADLSRHVERIALAKLHSHGYSGIYASADAPNSYGELVARYYHRKDERYADKFPVFDGASDTSIYVRPLTNLLFRAWHDLTHIELDADFSFRSEVIVARNQAQSIPEGLLREIFLADTEGQSEFAEWSGGAFVANQAQYVLDYLNLGQLEAMCRAFPQRMAA